MATSGAARPLVGVTTSEMRVAEQVDQTRHGEPPRREMALGIAYLTAVEAAGAVPVAIPPLEADSARPLLRRLSGLVLSGGPDIHPTAYGADAHEELGPTWPELDRFEISLAREADALRLPILAICRGAQALNVARTGTLFQHVPERFGAQIDHRQPGYGATPAHSVEVDPASTLARALGGTTVEVNSYHHQAADEVGRGLRAVAWSPDGLIEAVEAPGRDFVIGVQWHAEAMAPQVPEQAALFLSFVEAAERYESVRAEQALAA
jgi:putative glutamine amidotransferase